MAKKIDRTGEINYNSNGSKMTIVRCNGNKDIDILFEYCGYIARHNQYANFKKGNVQCPYDRTVMGIGYIGEGCYSTTNGMKGEMKDNSIQYKYWRTMIERCYDLNYHKKRPTYRGCTVCEEWHNYSNFSKWYEENYYKIDNETMCLDKDILVKGNKMYSPETCIFVPIKINCLFTKSNNSRGKYPIGVNYNSEIRKYQSRCGNGLGKSISLGYYETPQEAFEAYKINKERYIKQVADEYKDKIPQKLYEVMYNWEVEITD